MKKIIFLFGFVLAFVAITTTTNAQLARPQINNIDLKSVLPIDQNVKTGQLDNGMKYYIRTNKKPEKRAELMLAVKVGSVVEDEDQRGLAHFCEHMAFNGSKNFPKNDLVNYLESIGMRFGADLNAYTSFDETVYMLTVPTDTAKILHKGFDVLEDWAHNVSYDETEINKERGVVTEEWRLGKGAFDRIMKKQLPLELYKSKYAERLPIGDTMILKHCPSDNLRRFYKEWYRPDLMAVIAVGDFDKNDIEKLIKEHFGNIPNPTNERKREKFTIPFHKETLISIATDKELPQTIAQIMIKHDKHDPKLAGTYRMGIVERLINGMMQMRLDELTRKPNPPFVQAGAGSESFLGDKTVYGIGALVKENEIKSGLEAALTEAYRASKSGFNQTELDRQKESYIRDMEQLYDEKDKTESKNYAR